jgi:hypothetical protein
MGDRSHSDRSEYANYSGYEKQTDREIPVIRLTLVT